MLDFCSPVLMSAAAFHLRVLDRVMLKAVKFSDGLIVCDLEHSHRVAALCKFYKIHCNLNHAQEAAMPRGCVPAWLASLVVSAHSRYLDVLMSRTAHLSRS